MFAPISSFGLQHLSQLLTNGLALRLLAATMAALTLATAQSALAHESSDSVANDQPAIIPPSGVFAPIDSDRDGIADLNEDKNLNGLVDAGESDPHLADSDGDGVADGIEVMLGTAPDKHGSHFPEPIGYDLMRGLDARAGEVEINTLFLGSFSNGGDFGLKWAPEVEWAIVDGFAVELEPTFDGYTPNTMKAGFQATLPGGEEGRWLHGLQVLAEVAYDTLVPSFAATWIADLRIADRMSGVLIAGPQATLNAANTDGRDPTQAAVEMAALVNVSIFSDISPIFTWGIESNVAATASDVEWRLLPQVHAQVEKHWRIQAAAGVEGGLATPPFRSHRPACHRRDVARRRSTSSVATARWVRA